MPFWIGLMTKPVAALSGVMAEELIKETAEELPALKKKKR
jgi:hypothetical protein